MSDTEAPAETPAERINILTNLSLMLSVLWVAGVLSVPGLILAAIAGHKAQKAGESMVLPIVAIAVALIGLIGAVFFWRWVL